MDKQVVTIPSIKDFLDDIVKDFDAYVEGQIDFADEEYVNDDYEWNYQHKDENGEDDWHICIGCTVEVCVEFKYEFNEYNHGYYPEDITHAEVFISDLGGAIESDIIDVDFDYYNLTKEDETILYNALSKVCEKHAIIPRK